MLVICATDKQYVEMTGVLIRSIACQDHAEGAEIIVFGTSLRQGDKAKLAACAGPSTSVSFIDLDRHSLNALRDLGSTRHLSMTAYARIMLPDLLADRRGRALYLDCDIVINTSLDPLFSVDLDGCPVGAVQNAMGAPGIAKLNEAIARDDGEPYFNSGVLLIDLDQWRREEITQRCMDFAAGAKGLYDADQAVLNKVTTGRWKALDSRWNDNPDRFDPAQARDMPVQHFWGRKKPYFSDYPLALREMYDRYRATTPWATSGRTTPLQRSFHKRLQSLSRFYAKLRPSSA